eukprot:NODE_389_length_1556_cov_126.589223_g357_i0.p1 GENE.NODE_389_length_1556_cov_126.589223_g357_i0~~NODE_389_length_1556_cov_126.589223_g357_i0.p1  ORF type:complete len:357 (+),score=119.28 NODE_389_length_1556_cov_126.589223_g357_i0:410-1480(+)
MKKMMLPAVSILEGDKVADFAASERVVVVGYFNSLEDEEYSVFSSVADKLREDVLFGATTDKSAAESMNFAGTPAVHVVKKFDELLNVYDGEYTKSALTDFIRVSATPLIDDIGPQNYQNYVDSGLPLAYIFIGDEDDRAAVGPQIEPVAKDLKGKMNFVFIDGAKFGGHANNLNLKSGDWPAFSVQQPDTGAKYPYSQDETITEEAIRAHCNGVLDGSIEPSMKSAEIPEPNDEPVTIVVNKNYEAVVHSDKDVLIEFYAPWCGHCKKLVPVWDELGEALQDNDKIVIAKMDATENDLPTNAGFQVQGFPTIKLVTATNEVIAFNGDRTVEGFMEFLKDKATNGASIEDSKRDEL